MTTLKEKYKTIATRYLNALKEANTAGILSLFAPDAEVSSPLYGVRLAKDFYSELFEDTSKSRTRLIKCIVDESKSSMALVFHYQWTLKQGRKVAFDCVDIIEFDYDHKITSLQILYDTYEVRPYLT